MGEVVKSPLHLHRSISIYKAHSNTNRSRDQKKMTFMKEDGIISVSEKAM